MSSNNGNLTTKRCVCIIPTKQAEIDDLDLNVRDVMDTWILQMGYPVVTISRDDNDPTVVHVTQEYFQLNDSSEVSTKYPSSFGYVGLLL